MGADTMAVTIAMTDITIAATMTDGETEIAGGKSMIEADWKKAAVDHDGTSFERLKFAFECDPARDIGSGWWINTRCKFQ
jgi:hypothetical protein